MGRLRFGVAFAVRVRKWKGITPIPTASSGQALAFPHRGGRDKKRLPRRGEETEEGNWGQQVAKVNYPVQGTPGSLTSL